LVDHSEEIRNENIPERLDFSTDIHGIEKTILDGEKATIANLELTGKNWLTTVTFKKDEI